MQTETAAEPRGKKKKANGQAGPETTTNGHAGNGAAPPAEGIDPFSKPGENGIATQDAEPVSAPYTPPQPTQNEIRLAGEVLTELRDRAQDLGPQKTIEGLIQVVDVHPEFITPEGWPGEEDELYLEAGVVREIVNILLRGCGPKLAISPRKVACLWKNHEKWTKGGKTVRTQTVSHDARTRFYTGGVLATIEVNFHHFRTLNPLQKVFSLYHALRELDAAGSRQPPDFVGYFDELEVFGPYVFREMVTMFGAAKRGQQDASGLPYQLSLLDEMTIEEKE